MLVDPGVAALHGWQIQRQVTDDAPRLGSHDQDSIRQAHGFHQVVGNHQHAHAACGLLGQQECIEIFLQADVERGEWLVEQQQVGLQYQRPRALVLQPDLLLLDEPFAALDIGLKEDLYALLLAEQAARGMGVLMITHDLMEAVRLADRILIMAAEPGRIVSHLALDLPAVQRSDAWIYQHTAELLQLPAVRESFGLASRAPQTLPNVAKVVIREAAPSPSASRARSRC